VEWLVLWLIMGGVVAIIAGSKGFSWFPWFLYGAAIWPIALVHVLVSASAHGPTPIPVVITEGLTAHHVGSVAGSQRAAPTLKTCPDCAEQVLAAARICRFCRHEFAADPPPSPVPAPAAADRPRRRPPGHVPFGMKACASCGTHNWHDATACKECGTSFALATPARPDAPARKVCAACGEDSAAYADRCPKCSTFFPLPPAPAAADPFPSGEPIAPPVMRRCARCDEPAWHNGPACTKCGTPFAMLRR